MLLTAAYGLFNANAKWKDQSDSLLLDLGLHQLAVFPKLLYVIRDDYLVLSVAKISDDLIATGLPDVVDGFYSDFKRKFQLGAVARGPGRLPFYGVNIIQEEDLT